jgi:ABC-2 type transport system permease protein
MSDIIMSILPGMMYFWVLFIGQGPMQEVLQDKANRTLARMLASPVTVGQFIVAKMVRCFLLCGVGLALLTGISAVTFSIHWGNPVVLAAVIGACSLSMCGVLSTIYAIATTREQGNVVSSVVLLVLAMIGGGMLPFENLPGFLQMIGRFTPNRLAVLAFRAAAKSALSSDLLLPLVFLAAAGLAGCLVSYVLFKRQLENPRQP